MGLRFPAEHVGGLAGLRRLHYRPGHRHKLDRLNGKKHFKLKVHTSRRSLQLLQRARLHFE